VQSANFKPLFFRAASICVSVLVGYAGQGQAANEQQQQQQQAVAPASSGGEQQGQNLPDIGEELCVASTVPRNQNREVGGQACCIEDIIRSKAAAML
jgi:hypothetical protein